MLPLAYIKSSFQYLASRYGEVTVQAKTRGIVIEKYIEEGLLALLPLYRERAGPFSTGKINGSFFVQHT
jgi:hypothetical protein